MTDVTIFDKNKKIATVSINGGIDIDAEESVVETLEYWLNEEHEIIIAEGLTEVKTGRDPEYTVDILERIWQLVPNWSAS